LGGGPLADRPRLHPPAPRGAALGRRPPGAARAGRGRRGL